MLGQASDKQNHRGGESPNRCPAHSQGVWAPVIALCHDEEGIANDPERRFRVAEKIVRRAKDYGLQEADILVDPLVLTVGAEATAGAVTIFGVRYRMYHSMGLLLGG